MRRASATKRAKPSVPSYTCHWGHVTTSRPDSLPTRTAVWICEYPYRSMRADGPNEECAGCPIWEARCRAQRAAEAAVAAVNDAIPVLVH